MAALAGHRGDRWLDPDALRRAGQRALARFGILAGVPLFLIPLCVSSFSALAKGRDFFLIFPLNETDNLAAVGVIVLFAGGVAAARAVSPKTRVLPSRRILQRSFPPMKTNLITRITPTRRFLAALAACVVFRGASSPLRRRHAQVGDTAPNFPAET